MIRRTLHVAAWVLAVALVVLPVVAVVNGWIGGDRWPLRTLRINEGLEQVDTARVREAVLPHAQRGFFAVRLDDARSAIAGLPWVDEVAVRKRWPDVLEVHVAEHRPFARWGDDRLLSQQGRLFPAAGIEPDPALPLLHGPDARASEVKELYTEASALFAAQKMAVRSVALDERGSWSLVLDGGTRVTVGSQEARLRLRRFARVLPALLASRPDALARADLRYTNGFALEWAKPGIGNDGEPGVGNRESGIGQAEMRAAPALAIPDSRFPIPGSTTAAFPDPRSRIPKPGSTT